MRYTFDVYKESCYQKSWGVYAPSGELGGIGECVDENGVSLWDILRDLKERGVAEVTLI